MNGNKVFVDTNIILYLFGGDKTMCAYPHQTWNLGFNFMLLKSMTLNLNYRGWASTKVRSDSTVTPSAYTTLGPSHVFDVALVDDAIGNTGWGVTLYVKNLFDASNKLGLVYSGGYWIDCGRSVGAKVGYKF